MQQAPISALSSVPTKPSRGGGRGRGKEGGGQQKADRVNSQASVEALYIARGKRTTLTVYRTGACGRRGKEGTQNSHPISGFQ